MGGPLVISQMTAFGGSLVGSELFPLVATSNNALTNFNISATGIAAFVVVNFPAQSPNTVYSGPASGVATAAPTFRALVTADIPLIPVPGGGTNTTTLTNNGVLYGQGTSTVGITPNAATGAILLSNGTNAGPSFQAAGTSGFALVSNGTVSLPTYQLINLTTGATGIVTVPFGGTSTSTLTQNGILFGNAANTVGITGAGNTALVLISPGPLANPAFGQVSLTAAVTGVLAVSQGGTQTSTLTQNGLLFGNAANTVGITAAGNTAFVMQSPGPLQSPTFQSLATTIDNAIGSTQGAILTRNATNWIILPPGANGNVLQAQGAAANLQWAAAGAGSVTSISAAYGLSSLGVGTSGQTAITASGTLTRVEFVSQKTAAYTIATTDLGSLITFSSASLATFTLPTPNSTALGTGFFCDIENINAGTLVLLASACLVNGVATVALTKSQGGRIVIDGTNYQFVGDTFGVVSNITAGVGLTGGTITTTGTIAADIATAAQILADTANKLIEPVGLWSAALVSTLTFTTGTIAVDFNTGSNFGVTLTGNCTLGNPSNTKIGQNGVIFIIQDSTGSRTMAYTTSWKFIGGTAPVLSIASSAVDLLSFFVKDSTHVYATLMPNMK